MVGIRPRLCIGLGVALPLLALALSLTLPSVLRAEESAELGSTIEAAIRSDPRSSEMSEAQIDGIVQALAEEAGAQGVTTNDLTWRPEEDQPAQAGPCGEINDFLCALTDAFGFSGSDLTIPIGLGVSSALLLFVLGMLLLHRHGHHPVRGAIGVPTTSPAVLSAPRPPTPPTPGPPV